MRHANGARRSRRLIALPSLLALCVLGTAGAPQPASAAAPSCIVDEFDAGRIDGDLNGDRRADVVVGLPTLSATGPAEAGGVDVHLSGGGRQRVTLHELGNFDAGETGAHFGAAVVATELEGDICDDLAIGAPGLDANGAVFLLRGSRLGLTSVDPVKIVAPDGATGDAFGSSLAAVHRQDGATDLWVGAPGRTVSGVEDAGEVYHFRVSTTLEVTLVDRLSYSTPGVAGSPAEGDRFGEVLAPTFRGITVGVPRRTVQGRAQAGEAVFVNASTPELTVQVFNQGSPSVAGTPEAGDRFGASAARGGVGVPGEDLGRASDAGMVQTFSFQAELVAPGRGIHQNTTGIPGKAEPGDRFGAALAGGTWLLCQEQSDLAIGAPGESIGSRAGAGSVTVLSLPTEGAPCAPARAFSQRASLPGRLAAGNHLGAALATLSGDRELEEDFRSTLVIGVPGQNSSVRDAGVVITGLNRTSPVYTAVGGDRRDLAFGSVLAPLP